jgi:peptide/nickel transport system permease protein
LNTPLSGAGTGTPTRANVSLGRFVLYLSSNPALLVGFLLLSALVLFSVLGSILWDTSLARPLSAPIAQKPSLKHPFGTDSAGRDLLAAIILGTMLTAKIGIVAGVLGTMIGTFLAFVVGYFGGLTDRIVTAIVDVTLTIPGLMVLVVLAATLQDLITTTSMGLIIALLAWREPTRHIRSQVIVMREAEYLKLARLSGSSAWQIIVSEMMPNLLPYIGATLVAAVAAAVLSSVGLEALGLGSRQESTLGMTIYWMMLGGAFVRGMWWWILAPLVVLIVLFTGMYLVAIGLDQFANPRLRDRT